MELKLDKLKKDNESIKERKNIRKKNRKHFLLYVCSNVSVLISCYLLFVVVLSITTYSSDQQITFPIHLNLNPPTPINQT